MLRFRFWFVVLSLFLSHTANAQYAIQVTPSGGFIVDPSTLGGAETVVDTTSFTATFVSFGGSSFEFYEETYDGVWVNPNGALGFGGANATPPSTIELWGLGPTIAPYFTDLDTTSGQIRAHVLADRFVATWIGVADELSPSHLVNAQVTLVFKTGRIEMDYGAVSAFDRSIVGIGPGAPTPEDRRGFSDLSTSPSVPYRGIVGEEFFGDFDLAGSELVFVAEPDFDGDSVANPADNCPESANPTQTDTDGDGRGDACDGCPGVVSSEEADSDGDGVADACDLNAYPPFEISFCPNTSPSGLYRFLLQAEDGDGDSIWFTRVRALGQTPVAPSSITFEWAGFAAPTIPNGSIEFELDGSVVGSASVADPAFPLDCAPPVQSLTISDPAALTFTSPDPQVGFRTFGLGALSWVRVTSQPSGAVLLDYSAEGSFDPNVCDAGWSVPSSLARFRPLTEETVFFDVSDPYGVPSSFDWSAIPVGAPVQLEWTYSDGEHEETIRWPDSPTQDLLSDSLFTIQGPAIGSLVPFVTAPSPGSSADCSSAETFVTGEVELFGPNPAAGEFADVPRLDLTFIVDTTPSWDGQGSSIRNDAIIAGLDELTFLTTHPSCGNLSSASPSRIQGSASVVSFSSGVYERVPRFELEDIDAHNAARVTVSDLESVGAYCSRPNPSGPVQLSWFAPEDSADMEVEVSLNGAFYDYFLVSQSPIFVSAPPGANEICVDFVTLGNPNTTVAQDCCTISPTGSTQQYMAGLRDAIDLAVADLSSLPSGPAVPTRTIVAVVDGIPGTEFPSILASADAAAAAGINIFVVVFENGSGDFNNLALIARGNGLTFFTPDESELVEIIEPLSPFYFIDSVVVEGVVAEVYPGHPYSIPSFEAVVPTPVPGDGTITVEIFGTDGSVTQKDISLARETTLTCPSTQSAVADPATGIASVAVTSTPGVGCGPVSITHEFGNGPVASGDFPIGTTPLTFMATDGIGGTAECTTLVEVLEPAGMADAGVQADAGQADAGQADAGQADAGQGDAGQADAGQGEAGQADAGQGEAGQADAGQADAGQADASQADAGQSDAGQADAGQSDGGPNPEPSPEPDAQPDPEPTVTPGDGVDGGFVESDGGPFYVPGCGCNAAEPVGGSSAPVGLWGLLGAMVWWVRRRR